MTCLTLAENEGFGGKGGPGNECARKACKNSPATGYNRSTGMWYCVGCSLRLNNENRTDAQRLFNGPLVILPDQAE